MISRLAGLAGGLPSGSGEMGLWGEGEGAGDGLAVTSPGLPRCPPVAAGTSRLIVTSSSSRPRR